MAQEKDFEFVSAAMDGELSDEELDRLLQDEDVQERWYQYHLIRDCMQYNQQVVGKDIEFTSQESFLAKLNAITEERKAALSSEEGVQCKQPVVREASNHNFRWFSVAASVLAVAVITWQMLPANHDSAAGEVATKSIEKVQPADSAVVSVSTKPSAAPGNKSADVVVPQAAIENQNNAEIKSAVQTEKQDVNQERQHTDVKPVVQ
ncbi:sigma-E factor negative regulatory protein [Neisseria wadsworthii]|uniref:sigma-E factor negative regulatory protein n=1 Tax=Neisseria wadsworthii TaxID=607711 RepID=UPI000D2F5E41|nr:sigma-E factor negative regulatory protein [Neisseria wadsworthii]